MQHTLGSAPALFATSVAGCSKQHLNGSAKQHTRGHCEGDRKAQAYASSTMAHGADDVWGVLNYVIDCRNFVNI